MAQTFYQPNYATDRRFAPSGFTIPSGPSIEEQNRMANAPAPVARPVQQGQAPAGAANPMDTLNKRLGTNFGAPYQNSAMRQAGESAPIREQIGQAMVGNGGLTEQRQAAQFQQAMTERGGMPDPNSPYFAQQMKVANAMFQQIYGKQAQPGNGQGAFGQPSTSYSPTGLRSRVLGAGGAEVEGIGGAMVSAAPNAQGGNTFMLRQGQPSSFMPPSVARAPAAQAPSGPSAAAMKFLQDGIDPNITAPAPMRQPVVAAAPQPVAQPAQPAPSALQSAQQEYQARISAMNAPRQAPIPFDYEVDPKNPNAVRPKVGSKDYVEQTKAAEKSAKRHANAAFSAKGIIDQINTADKMISKDTTGLSGYAQKFVPGSKALDLNETLETIMSDSAFSRLQQMREESPTGGALGNVANYELEALKRTRGSLSQSQSEKQLKANLKKVKGHYERFYIANAGFDPDNQESVKEFYAQMGSDVFQPQQEAGAPAQSGGSPIRITSIKLVP